MSQLTDAVLALDLSAAVMARAQGAPAIPGLNSLLTHEDTAVRTVAVIALGAVADPGAVAGLMDAARDEDGGVAVAAVDQLAERQPPLPATQFVSLLDSVPNPSAQRRLVLLSGAGNAQDTRSLLLDFCKKNTDNTISSACTAALAKLGLSEAQAGFSQYLYQTQSLEAFELAAYIHQKWLLPHLAQLLQRMDPVQTLGDPPPGFPNMLRVCDKAVVLISQISDVALSFPTNVHQNYDSAQLAEAAQVASSGR